MCKDGKKTLRHIFEECEWTKGAKNVEEIMKREAPDIKIW